MPIDEVVVVHVGAIEFRYLHHCGANAAVQRNLGVQIAHYLYLVFLFDDVELHREDSRAVPSALERPA
jgi:hypothetical protein